MGNYRGLIKFLREQCPVDCPVRVIRTKTPKGTDGDCLLMEGKGYYRIRISNRLDEGMCIETLIHEWAHAVAWRRCQRELHGCEWGKAYSKVYRAFLQYLKS